MISKYFIVALLALSHVAASSSSTTTTTISPAATDINLGELDSMNSFYSILGGNASNWHDITVYESDAHTASVPRRGSLSEREVYTAGSKVLAPRDSGYCYERTAWEKVICEGMPNHGWQFAYGGAMPIYYSPQLVCNWLEDLGTAIREGRDVKRASKHGSKISRRDGLVSNATDVYFSIPWKSRGLVSRATGSDTNLTILNHYKYHVEDDAVFYRGTTGSLTPRGASQACSDLVRDYTIVIETWRKSKELTTTSAECIAQVLRWHLDRAAEENRFICTQLDAQGDWFAWLQLSIRRGSVSESASYCCSN